MKHSCTPLIERLTTQGCARAHELYRPSSDSSGLQGGAQGGGQLSWSWPGSPAGTPGAGCTSGVAWPLVEAVVVLGSNSTAPQALSIQVVGTNLVQLDFVHSLCAAQSQAECWL